MKRKGLVSLEVAIYIVIVLGLLSMLTLHRPEGVKKSVEEDRMRQEMLLVDQGLSLYYASHNDGEKGVYPANLNILKGVGILANGLDLSAFSYSTRNGGTQYRLTVKLPVSGLIVSPNSKF